MRHDPVGPNVEALQRALGLLARLSDRQYVAVDARLSTASIGAHVRHVLDHYALFLAGVERGEIDYDARERDGRVERERGAAAECAERLIAGLAGLRAADLARAVRVRQQGSYEAGRFDGCESRVERELLFLQSHAVHHFALIAVLARAQGVELPASFGMAPSTVAYLARQAGAGGPAGGGSETRGALAGGAAGA